MKSQPKFYSRINLTGRLWSLVGAALFLMPLAAQALTGPDLSVTKTCVSGANQSVQCTVTVTNIGQVASVAPLSVQDTPTAPAGSAYPDSKYTGAGGSLPISCSLGAGPVLPIPCNANKSLQPGESATALFSFQFLQGGSFKNCVTVTQAQNAATLPDPNPGNNTNICTTINVPSPPGGKLTISKQVINNNPGIATPPGPYEVQVKCNPNVPYSSVSLSASNSFQHTINLPAGGHCKIEETPPIAPPGCKWITTYPNGQNGKVGDTLVVLNKLECGGSSCKPPLMETIPGYCCDGKPGSAVGGPGSDKFCCWKKQ